MRSSILFAAMLLVLVSPLYVRSNAFGDEQQPAQAKDEDEQKNYFYRWTDGKGVVHISDGLGKVPKQYRSTAKRVESGSGATDESTEVQNDDSASSDYSKDEEQQADLKEYWQQRMKDAKTQLADAEQRYQELDRKRNEAGGKWGGIASGHLEGRAEVERIEQEMKGVQKEIDDARHQIDVVVPDEARKAGVPPGWLRE